MKTKSAILFAWVLLSVAFATGCAGNARVSGDGEEDRARLEIGGSSGNEFSGSCAVGDEEPEEIGGQAPKSFTYDLKGRPLDCEVSSDGDLRVDLTVGEDAHSVHRISGGGLDLTYENGSVSSVASSSSRAISPERTNGQEPGDKTSGSTNVTSESRSVSGFDEVELRGVGNLSIQQTGSESLTVEAEEDVLPKLRTEVENDRLIIGPRPNTTIRTTEPINYKLNVKDLDALKVSGSGNVDAEGISTDELAVVISGTGNVRISGGADSQDIDISGSGNYRAEDLRSKEAKIDLGGAGSAIVNASDELNAEVSGSGSVEYIGDPTVHQDVSGVGRVSRH